MKICANIECQVELTEVNCYRKSNGYLRSYCKSCHNIKTSASNKISSKESHRKEKANLKRRLSRQDPNKLAAIIVTDSKNSDSKFGRDNNLTKETVTDLIHLGCSYCGEQELRMTLDRIDNSLGHTVENVVSACIRCNYARRSMPHAAWLCLISGLKEAREKGLFGNWTGRCR